MKEIIIALICQINLIKTITSFVYWLVGLKSKCIMKFHIRISNLVDFQLNFSLLKFKYYGNLISYIFLYWQYSWFNLVGIKVSKTNLVVVQIFKWKTLKINILLMIFLCKYYIDFYLLLTSLNLHMYLYYVYYKTILLIQIFTIK